VIGETFARLGRAAPDAWPCWAYSNHDTVRHLSRWKLSDQAARAYTVLLMCLRGSVCLYQGEELGLPEADVAFEDLQDPYGIQFWPEFKGRDGCRTPMVWEADNRMGGFTTAAKSWLPVAPEHLNLAAARQTGDATAMLEFYRAVLAFRHANPVLRNGAQNDMTVSGDVVSFRRSDGETTMFCAFNLGNATAQVDLPAGTWRDAGAPVGAAQVSGTTITLGPWQVCLATGQTD
jgi:alpha-glucosidase